MNTLRQAIHEYLALRRGLGFKLREAGNGLLDFSRFMERHHASYITEELAVAWAQQSSRVQPAWWAARLGYVRAFARHRSATDPRTQIPRQSILPFQPKRARPYLYSHAEIQSLLRAALKMRYRYERGALRPSIYYCLFGLLSISGLRLGEARNLELQDIDLKARVLTIRGTKFGKSRLVPLHASTCKVLADYIIKRQRHWAGRVASSYLFLSSSGSRLDNGDVHRTFYALSREIGIRAFEAPSRSAQIQRVLAIPSKRFTRTLVQSLARTEVDALLAAPDQRTWSGRRDHALILLAVQTGLRLSEVTGLKREDIILGTGAHVRVIGKGRKERCTPISRTTLAVLKVWLRDPQRGDGRLLFPSARGERLSVPWCPVYIG
jgi:integrase/recombinase XerD